MTAHTSETSAVSTQTFVLACGLLVMGLGTTVLAAWVLDIAPLKSIFPGFSTMKVNTALCFLLSGGALLQWCRDNPHQRPGTITRSLALAAAALSAATLLEYGAGWDLGIDQLLIRDADLGPQPGRMSVFTAVSFMLFGIAFSLPTRTASPVAIVFTSLSTAGLVIGLLGTVGYIYQVRILYEPGPATSLALHTTLGFATLFLGSLMSRPDHGWPSLILRPGSIGMMVRVVLPTLILVPVLLGWLGLKGLRADLYGPNGLMAWFVIAAGLVLIMTVLIIARRAAALDDTLRAKEHVHATVLEHSLDAFIMMSAEGRILEWNTQAERTFGWRREEVLGRSIEATIVPESLRAQHRDGLTAFLATGDGPVIRRRSVLNGLRRDGEEFPVELMIVPIHVDGEWMFSGFLRDISQQRETEEQLRHRQKLDAIGQLTGGVAHDFNNLLTVIIGNLDLLISRHGSPAEDLAKPALQAAERGAALVQRLLAFARRQALIPEQVRINDLVIDMDELLRRTLREDIRIELRLEDGVWPVYADAGQVESALLNLAVNARDAMPDGGTLTVETANTHLDEDYAAVNAEVTPGDYVLLAVTDTGTGMPQDVVERAFDPFFTTKGPGKGSGLGLSMIYGFAKQSNGHLKIYSEPGHGTTVRLYLPRLTSEAQTRRVLAPVRPDAQGHGETILVVEDDVAVREFVVGTLTGLGYRVIEAIDGDSALAALAAEPRVDLLFTDVVMPGDVTGRQLAEAVVAERPDIHVLFTSGYTQNSVVHQGRLDADVHFIAKPYRKEELAARIRAVLDQHVDDPEA